MIHPLKSELQKRRISQKIIGKETNYSTSGIEKMLNGKTPMQKWVEEKIIKIINKYDAQ